MSMFGSMTVKEHLMDTLTIERDLIRSLCKKAGISDQLYKYRKMKDPDALLSELLVAPSTQEILFDIPGLGKKNLAWICKNYSINRSTMRGRIDREFTGDNIMDLLYSTGGKKSTTNAALHIVNGESKTLREWSKHSPRSYGGFLTAVRKYNIDAAINAPLGKIYEYVHGTAKVQVRKVYKSSKELPDTSHLAYDENLHYKRLVASLGEEEALKRIKVF